MLPRTMLPNTRPTAAGLFRAPMAAAIPMMPLACSNGGSSFVKLAAKNAKHDGWSSIAFMSPMASGHRFAAVSSVAFNSPAYEDDTVEAFKAVASEPQTASVGAPSLDLDSPALAFFAAMLVVGGALSIASLLGFFKRRSPQGANATDPHERETVPIEDPEMVDLDRPTVAATPDALRGKRPSFGVRIGGENIPGASIMPPPAPRDGRGGSNIE